MMACEDKRRDFEAVKYFRMMEKTKCSFRLFLIVVDVPISAESVV